MANKVPHFGEMISLFSPQVMGRLMEEYHWGAPCGETAELHDHVKSQQFCIDETWL
jgi:hypothetical protein